MSARVMRAGARRYAGSGALVGTIVVAVGVGASAFLAGRKVGPEVDPSRYRMIVPEYDVVEVPVPERVVSAGTLMRDVGTRLEKFPKHQLPRGVVLDAALVRDRAALVSLPSGLPIIEGNLGGAEELGNPIIGRIPPGMRAMTVKVDATSAVEGWARSGSIVDVLLVEKTKTTVVAEQVKVISAERSLSPVGSTTQGVPSTVTLLVTQEQCLAIHTAVPLGKIAFALRSLKDEENWRATRFSSEDFNGAHNEVRKSRIGGVVEFGVGADRKRYALVDGAWIVADALPSGFFLNAASMERVER